MVIARWVQSEWKYKWDKIQFFFGAVGVYVILKIINAIPLFGWLPVWIAILTSFGAILALNYKTLSKKR